MTKSEAAAEFVARFGTPPVPDSDLLEKLIAWYAKRMSKAVRAKPTAGNADLLSELHKARLAHRQAKAAYTDKA